MIPQKNTKTNQILKELESLSPTDRQNQLLMKRYKKAAEDIRLKNPLEGYILRGAVAALEKNIDEVRQLFRIASYGHNNSSLLHLNYAVCFRNLNFLDEALESIVSAYQGIDYNDLDILNEHIKILMCLGRFQKATELLERWNRLSPKNPNRSANDILNASQIMEKNDLTDEETKTIFEIAFEILKNRNVYFDGWRLQILEELGLEWLQFDIITDLMPHEAMAAKEELVDRLDEVPPTVAECIEIDFLPHPEYVKRIDLTGSILQNEKFVESIRRAREEVGSGMALLSEEEAFNS